MARTNVGTDIVSKLRPRRVLSTVGQVQVRELGCTEFPDHAVVQRDYVFLQSLVVRATQPEDRERSADA